MNSKAIKITSVICAVVMFTLVCVLVFQLISIGNLKAKEKQLSNTLYSLEREIVDYTNEANYLRSNENLEDYAREVLGWGKDNEMYFD